MNTSSSSSIGSETYFANVDTSCVEDDEISNQNSLNNPNSICSLRDKRYSLFDLNQENLNYF
jgi:hypothetical protein